MKIVAERKIGDQECLDAERTHYLRLGRDEVFVQLSIDHIVQVDGAKKEAGPRYPFQKYEPNPIYIGRGVPIETGMDVNHPSVSKLHARVWRTKKTLYASDRKSANGTFVVEFEDDAATYPVISDGEMGRRRARRTYEFRGYVVSGPAGDDKAPRFFVDETQVDFGTGRVLMVGMPPPRVEMSRTPGEIDRYRVVVFYRRQRLEEAENEARAALHEQAAAMYEAPGQGPLEPGELRFEFYPGPPNPNLPLIRDRELALKLVRFLQQEYSAGKPFAPTIEEAAKRLRLGFTEGA